MYDVFDGEQRVFDRVYPARVERDRLRNAVVIHSRLSGAQRGAKAQEKIVLVGLYFLE